MSLFSICVFAGQTGNTINPIFKKAVLFPYKKAVMGSDVDAFVAKYNVKEGDTFKKGDVIAELDSRKYDKMYKKSLADLKSAESGYKYAKDMYEINLKLSRKNAISKNELKDTEHKMNVAESELDHAKVNLEIAKDYLDSCVITAPFCGRLIQKFVHEHEYVETGEPIMEIFDDNKLLAVVNLPSTEITNYSLGKEMDFKVFENHKDYDGEVYSISGNIKPGSHTFQVKALIDNSSRELVPGMSAVLLEQSA